MTGLCNGNPPRGIAQAAGFTLLEMLITVAIAAIFLALAMPSFQQIIIQMNETSNTNNLLGALNLARAEAVKRGVPVAVIANAGATATAWSTTGWYVQASTAAGVFTGGDVLRQYAPLASGYGVTSGVSVSSCAGACTSTGQIVFGSTGALLGASSVTLNVCRPDQNAAKESRVVIQPSGTMSSYASASSSAPAC